MLILNAGARLPMKPIDQQSWEEFSTAWNTDVRAGLVGIQAALNTPMKTRRPRSGHVERRFDGAGRAVHPARKLCGSPAAISAPSGCCGSWPTARTRYRAMRGLGLHFQVLVPLPG